MTRKIYHRPAPYTQHRRSPAYTLVSPDGTTYTRIPDLHAFCIAHKLNHDAVYKLVQGEVDDVEGWKRLE
jgi:hypothetical protein